MITANQSTASCNQFQPSSNTFGDGWLRLIAGGGGDDDNLRSDTSLQSTACNQLQPKGMCTETGFSPGYSATNNQGPEPRRRMHRRHLQRAVIRDELLVDGAGELLHDFRFENHWMQRTTTQRTQPNERNERIPRRVRTYPRHAPPSFLGK